VISALPLEALLVAADVEDAKEEREKEINSSPGTRIKACNNNREATEATEATEARRGEARRGVTSSIMRVLNLYLYLYL
jgi:hypothetical protein